MMNDVSKMVVDRGIIMIDKDNNGELLLVMLAH